MTRRLLLLAFALNFVVAAASVWGQTNRVPIVGQLAVASGPDDPIVKALRDGLRQLGYLEGRNIRFEYRTAQGNVDRLRGLAEELVQLKADVIVVGNTSAAQEVKRATSSIPIVMVLVADPVGSGLVTNLAHPGGNVTGRSSMTTELNAKRLQLLKETIPRLTRVAVLWNPGTPPMPVQTKMVEDLKAVAPTLSIELSLVNVPTPEEFGAAFRAVSRAHAQALYLVENPLFYSQRATLAKLASEARLPAIYGTRAFADAGGLMSYGVNYADESRRAAEYVDKILRAAKPSDLPIEQPIKFELIVNLKTAKALGIAIPESILLRADELIK